MADLNLQMNMNKYQWKIASLAKGIDPQKAIEEIEKIESLFGSITPETILEASSDESSVLHSLFQWDDSKAAHQFRLQQARTILNNVQVKVISNGEERVIPVFEIVKAEGERVYKSIQVMSKDDIEYVMMSAKREIVSLRNKLSVYQDFNKVVGYLDLANESLSK